MLEKFDRPQTDHKEGVIENFDTQNRFKYFLELGQATESKIT